MSRHGCGSSTACFDQLSGTSIVFAIGAFRPARTSTSNTASKRAGIRRTVRNDRLDVLGHVAKRGRRHPDLVRFHPVDVALQRVDFAVVRQHAERLRQPPLREGVGRIPLVIDRKGALEPLVLQIGIKLGHLLGQHHAFVDDRPARQLTQIKLETPAPQQPPFRSGDE